MGVTMIMMMLSHGDSGDGGNHNDDNVDDGGDHNDDSIDDDGDGCGDDGSDHHNDGGDHGSNVIDCYFDDEGKMEWCS